MRDPKRIKRILKLIKEIWQDNKDQRFFQLLFNYTQLARTDKLGYVKDPFYYEDDELLNILEGWKAIKEHNQKLEKFNKVKK